MVKLIEVMRDLFNNYYSMRMKNSYKKIAIRLTLFIFIVFSSSVTFAATYYLSPSGSDASGNGTLASPWFTLNKAWTAVKAGDIVYMKGGNYLYPTGQKLHNKSGSAGNMIKVWAMPGEQPVIAPAAGYNGTRGIDVLGNFIHIKGLEIKDFAQRTSTALYYGIVAENSNSNIYEQLSVHDNGFGLSIGSDSGDNLVLNSDFYRNSDPLSSFGRNVPWGGSDGITIRTSNLSKTNTIRGCRMWWNSDDGVDLFENHGLIIIENSWAFWNGYKPGTFTTAGNGDGFKVGITLLDLSSSVKRIVRNNLSFENRTIGFDQNDAKCITHLYNNTSYNNGNLGPAARSFNFWNGTAATVAKNNLDFKSTMSALFNSQAVVSHNSFTQNGTVNSSYSVTADDFVSLDNTGVNGPRKSDGSLPDLNFLKLVQESDLVNKGTDVGLPFNGSAPDLGACETGSSHVADVSRPVVSAFIIPATASSLTVSLSNFTATDNVGVTGYLVNETAAVPSLSNSRWSSTAPATYQALSTGTKTLYAWAKNAAGNISASVSRNVTISQTSKVSPTITEFIVPSTASSLTVPISSFKATHSSPVTGYLVNETAAVPSLSNSRWSSAAPKTYQALSSGTKKLYAWTRDAAGNISASMNDGVTISVNKSAESTSVSEEDLPIDSNLSNVVTDIGNMDEINELSQSIKIDVFPNPCIDNVTVRFSEMPEQGSRIEIVDITGRTVASREIADASERFYLSEPAGLYMVKTIVGSNEVINKLIINK